MRALLSRFGPYVGLVLTRSAAVILFTLAGVTVAGVYFQFLLALLVGTLAGVVLGLAADRAAYVYGKRVGWTDYQAHLDRQAAARRRAQAQHNVGRLAPADLTTRGKSNLLPAVLADLAARELAPAGAAATPGGSRLVDDAAVSEGDALVQLRELVKATLQPRELIGQQGRGVIQLAAELGPLVPTLNAETVTAYISDHVLVAAGQEPEHADRWGAALDGVEPLQLPAGYIPPENIGLERWGLPAAAGEHLPALLDTIVHVTAYSGGVGLSLAQTRIALAAKGFQVGTYTLAGAMRRLVELGRLVPPTGGGFRYRLSEAELVARATLDEGTRPPAVDARLGPVGRRVLAVVDAGDPHEGLDIEAIVAGVTTGEGALDMGPALDVAPLDVLDTVRVLKKWRHLEQLPTGNYRQPPF